MLSTLRSLCVSVFVAWTWWSCVRATGAVVHCEPCDAGARTLCKPVSAACAERVREPGCGCCMTCALREGQRCGVYTGRCAAGLTCIHLPGESEPLRALLEGRGVCGAKNTRGSTNSVLSTTEANTNARNPEEVSGSNATDVSVTTWREPTMDVHHNHAPHSPPPAHHPKSEVLRRDQARKSQSFKLEDPPPVSNSEQINFSFEPKLEREYGPCRVKMEEVLRSLKISDLLNPRGLRLPNCDKKGFYKKKQCRPSKGRKRGICWCVDKYGQPLPGFEGEERGSAHCYGMENP